MSSDWSCWLIQSLASWNHTACCRTMILSISYVWGWGNLHWVMRLKMHVQCMKTLARELPDIGEQFVPEGPKMVLRLNSCPNSIQCIFMLSSMMMPLSMRDWRACLSSPSKMNFSCSSIAAVISLISLYVKGIQVSSALV